MTIIGSDRPLAASCCDSSIIGLERKHASEKRQKISGDQPSKEPEYLLAIRDALREELGNRGGATKTIMRWTGASDRTARNWMSGAAGPSGYHLICLARESPAVLSTVLEMSGRAELALSADVHAVEVALAKASGALAVLRRQSAGRKN